MNIWDEFDAQVIRHSDNKDVQGRRYAQTLVESLHCVSATRSHTSLGKGSKRKAEKNSSLDKPSLDIPLHCLFVQKINS